MKNNGNALRKPAHSLRQRERIERLFAAANSALADARVAFVSLFLLTLLLASVASTTTHLDLLLGSKISLPAQNVEVSRQAMLLIGSLILSGIHFQALRSHLLAAKQLAGLSSLSPNPHLLGLELKTNMITDAFFASVGNVFSRALSNILLCAVLLISPLLTLFFVQLVTLPAHSSLLTGLVRLILVVDTVITVVAMLLFYRYLKYSRNGEAHPHYFSAIVACVITFLPALAGMSIAIFPGEYYEGVIVRAVEMVAPKLVTSKNIKTDDKISFFGISCLIDFGYKRNQIAQTEQNSRAVNADSPEVFRMRPVASDAEITPTCRHYGPALISTITIMTWLESATGFGISRTFQLQGQTISGQNLPANERSQLSEHSEAIPLHAEFHSTLAKVIQLDLSTKDLRYANFNNAFMPRVRLNGAMIHGATFHNANLQGAVIVNYESAHGISKIEPGHRLPSPFDSADLSAANFEKPIFWAEAIKNIKAITTKFDSCRFAGVEIMGGLWQGAIFNYCSFQDYEISKKSRLASRILAANMSGVKFLENDFYKIFIGSEQGRASNVANFDSTSWTHSKLSAGSIFSGVALRGADFSEAEVGEIHIINSDLSFATFKSNVRPESIVNSTLNPIFMLGESYEKGLRNDYKVYLLSGDRKNSMLCVGLNSGSSKCEVIDNTNIAWKKIAGELRAQSCDLATKSDGFNPDMLNQMIGIYHFGGMQARKFYDISAIPPTNKGRQDACGINLHGKRTAITISDKNEM